MTPDVKREIRHRVNAALRTVYELRDRLNEAKTDSTPKGLLLPELLRLRRELIERLGDVIEHLGRS